MRRYRVVITPFAGENIREAHTWIEAQNPIYAATWLSGIGDKILEPETLPESHAIAPKSESFDCHTRELLFGRGTPWRIHFTVHGTMVHVLHFRHSTWDYWRP